MSSTSNTNPEPASSGTVLAFDFGAKRIGVASGDLQLRIAHPLETIPAADAAVLFARISQLVSEWQPVLLIVGLPLSLAGKEQEATNRARRFARQLGGRYRLPVTLVDERLTSAEASMALREANLHGRKQKRYLDQVAAQRLLQSFFDGKGIPK